MAFHAVTNCPNTSKQVTLPINVETREAWDTATFENSQYDCPACGQLHLIVKDECRLVPDAFGGN